ncbi:MAG TPA: aminotransferase class IV [Desulfobacteria bacterium]|nr:aminotransferase class IV [Desulfobacteria bacterium]
MEPIVYLNGKFVPLSQAKVSILDRGFCYGDALFETMRVYSGKIFQLDQHLDRLEQGAQNIFLKLPESRERIHEILYETFYRNQGADAVIRMTVTRGEGILGKLWQADTSPTLSVHVRPYSAPPAEWYQNGVLISLIPNSAAKLGNFQEQIKSTNYLSHILARKQAEDQNSADGIMINEQGEVCDGTVSNIFIVKDGELSTPAVNGYVLAGITRQVVIKLSTDTGTFCKERAMTVDDILQADELFLTNTGWEILPVARVDGKTVGSGQPGSLTRTLQREFRKFVDAEIGK